MRKEVCERIISECEQTCQKLGGDFYQVMQKAPQVVEKWKRYETIAQQVWHHASSREELTAFLLNGPEPDPQELETVLSLIRSVPYLLRSAFESAAKNLPPPPGGRPRDLTPQESKEICREIGWLYGQGVELRDAQKRMAQRYHTSLRTIQRAWQHRAQWKSDPI